MGKKLAKKQVEEKNHDESYEECNGLEKGRRERELSNRVGYMIQESSSGLDYTHSEKINCYGLNICVSSEFVS